MRGANLARICREAAEDAIFEMRRDVKRISDLCPYSVEQIPDPTVPPRPRQR